MLKIYLLSVVLTIPLVFLIAFLLSFVSAPTYVGMLFGALA